MRVRRSSLELQHESAPRGVPTVAADRCSGSGRYSRGPYAATAYPAPWFPRLALRLTPGHRPTTRIAGSNDLFGDHAQHKSATTHLARGVIGNTPVFGTGIPSSSLGGPVTPLRPTPSNMQPNASKHDSSGLAAIILAAGKGTRMGGDLPKVLHEVAGRPMVHWVIDAVRAAGAAPVLLVVGYREDLVRDACSDLDVTFVTQGEQKGTGHAVHVCAEALKDFTGDAFVLAGDGPLVRHDLLQTMIDTHRHTHSIATLATATVDDPTGYGRIVRTHGGDFMNIVEQKNATDEQLAINEVYPSYAVFNVPAMLRDLAVLPRDPISGEYYLTTVPHRLAAAGGRVSLVPRVDSQDMLSINTPEQLALVDGVLRNRLGMEVKA